MFELVNVNTPQYAGCCTYYRLAKAISMHDLQVTLLLTLSKL